MATTMIRIMNEGKLSFFNSSKRQIIPGEYVSATDFDNGFSIVEIVNSYNGRCRGLINEDGLSIIPCIFNSIAKIQDGLYKVELYDYPATIVGFYNTSGKIVDENGNQLDNYLQEYYLVKCLDNGFFLVAKVGFFGIYNGSELIITSDKPIDKIICSNGLIYVHHSDDRGYVLYDIQGKELIKNSYIEFINDSCFTCSEYSYGAKKIYGNDCLQLSPFKYSKVEPVDESRIKLFTNKNGETVSIVFDVLKRKFVTTRDDGQELLVDAKYLWCGPFHKSHAIVCIDEFLGAIDLFSNLCLPCVYEDIQFVDDKYVFVKQSSQWFLADWQNCIKSKGYASIQKMTDDYFLVSQDCNYGLINSNGEELVPCQYNSNIEILSDSRIIVSRRFSDNSQKNIYNNSGHLLVVTSKGEFELPKEIIWVNEFSDGVAVVSGVNGLSGIIDEYGRLIVPCKLSGYISAFHNGTAIREKTVGRRPYCQSYKTRINKEGKCVVKKGNEDIVILEDVQIANDFDHNCCTVYDGNHWGLVGTNGLFSLQSAYDEINHLIDSYYRVKKDGKYGIIFEWGNVIAPCIYSEIKVQDKHFLAISAVDYHHDPIIFVTLDREGSIIADNDGNQVVLPAVYEHVCNFEEGYAKVRKNGKWGLINSLGESVLDCIYDSIYNIKNSHALCLLDNNYYLVSLIDNSSIEVPMSNNAVFYSNDCIVIGNTYKDEDFNRVTIINNEGKRIVKNEFQYISEFVDGIAIFRERSYYRYGIINSLGEVLLKPIYSSLEFHSNKNYFIADFNDADKTRIIDLQGRTILFDGNNIVPLPEKFSKGRDFSEGRGMVFLHLGQTRKQSSLSARLRLNRYKWVDVYKYGFIDIDQNEVIPCQYDSATDFSGGISIVSYNSMYGAIDVEGNIVIPFEYDLLERSNSNYLKAKKDNRCGVLDYCNNTIIPFEYKDIQNPSEGLFPVCFSGDNLSFPDMDGLWGYVDYRNNIVIDPQFDSAASFSDGLANVSIGDSFSFINKEGKILFDCIGIPSPFNNGVSSTYFLHEGEKITYTLLSDGSIVVDGVKLKNLRSKAIAKVFDFHEGLAKVQMTDETFGFINTSGDIVVSMIKEEPSNFKDGFSSFEGPCGYPKQIINKEGKRIIKKRDNSIIIFPDIYYAVVELAAGYYRVIDNRGKQFVIDQNFIVIIAEVGNSVKVYPNYIQVNTRNDNSLYYDKEGSLIIPSDGIKVYGNYSATHESFSCGRAAVLNNGLWGFIDQSGKEVINCSYKEVSKFVNGFCIVTGDSFHKGVIDTQGNFVIPFNYFSEIIINPDGFIVYHDHFGYREDYSFEDEYGETRCGSEWHPDKLNFDISGRIVVPLYEEMVHIPSEYDWADYGFTEGFISVHKNDKWGCLDGNLLEVIPCVYDKKIRFEKGIAYTEKDSQKCVIDTFGREIILGDYCEIQHYEAFNLFVCTAVENEEYHVYNRYGDFVLNSKNIESPVLVPGLNIMSSKVFVPNQITPIGNGYIKFRIYEKIYRFNYWGICDLHGNVLIGARFDDVKGGGCGLFSVAKITTVNNHQYKKWGFVNTQGRQIVDFKYQEVGCFDRGLAAVCPYGSNHMYGIIGANGKELTDFIYRNITPCDEGMEVSNDDDKKNIINRQGNILLPYYDSRDSDLCCTLLKGYDWCLTGNNQLCIIIKGEKQGIIENTGRVYMPLTAISPIKIEFDDNDELVFTNSEFDEKKKINAKGQILTIKNGETILLPVGVHWCKEWKDDYIEVESFGNWGLLNRSLEYVVKPVFSDVQYISNHIVLLTRIIPETNEEEYHLYDIKKEKLTKINYSSCSSFKSDCAIVKKPIVIKDSKGKAKEQIRYGIIDIYGIEILPCIYEKIEFKEPEKVLTYYNYDSYDYYDDAYSVEASLMDALDGDPDAYWNID